MIGFAAYSLGFKAVCLKGLVFRLLVRLQRLCDLV